MEILGNSGFEISPIGLGTWAIGGARNPGQVDGFIGAMDFRLGDVYSPRSKQPSRSP